MLMDAQQVNILDATEPIKMVYFRVFMFYQKRKKDRSVSSCLRLQPVGLPFRLASAPELRSRCPETGVSVDCPTGSVSLENAG